MTTEQIDATIRRLTFARVPREHIAEAVGMTADELAERITTIWRNASGRGAPDEEERCPTPDEILKRAAELRRRWTPEQREARRMAGGER
jgi:hypothetical protein